MPMPETSEEFRRGICAVNLAFLVPRATVLTPRETAYAVKPDTHPS